MSINILFNACINRQLINNPFSFIPYNACGLSFFSWGVIFLIIILIIFLKTKHKVKELEGEKN